MRRAGELNGRKLLKLMAGRKDLAGMRAFIEKAAAGEGVDEEALADMLLAADEAVTNIILYGYKDQPGKIQIEVSYNGGALIIIIRDWSPPFDPNNVPTPDLSLPLELRPLGGMGVHLMRSFTDEMSYHTSPGDGNTLTLVRNGVKLNNPN